MIITNNSNKRLLSQIMEQVTELKKQIVSLKCSCVSCFIGYTTNL